MYCMKIHIYVENFIHAVYTEYVFSNSCNKFCRYLTLKRIVIFFFFFFKIWFHFLMLFTISIIFLYETGAPMHLYLMISKCHNMCPEISVMYILMPHRCNGYSGTYLPIRLTWVNQGKKMAMKRKVINSLWSSDAKGHLISCISWSTLTQYGPVTPNGVI